jgi:hypothetical protein
MDNEPNDDKPPAPITPSAPAPEPDAYTKALLAAGFKVLPRGSGEGFILPGRK